MGRDEEILKNIVEVVAEVLNLSDDEVDQDTQIGNILAADPDLYDDLTEALMRRFGLEEGIPAMQVQRFGSVKDIFGYIRSVVNR